MRQRFEECDQHVITRLSKINRQLTAYGLIVLQGQIMHS